MKYSEVVRQRIRDEYPNGDVTALAAEIGITENRLRTMATTLGVKRTPEAVARCREAARAKISESCKKAGRTVRARKTARTGLYAVFAQMVNV